MLATVGNRAKIVCGDQSLHGTRERRIFITIDLAGIVHGNRHLLRIDLHCGTGRGGLIVGILSLHIHGRTRTCGHVGDGICIGAPCLLVKTIGQRRARRISGGHRNAVSRAVVRAFVVRSHEVEIVSFLDGQLTGSVGYVIVLSNTAYNSCARCNLTRIYTHIGSLTVHGDARQCVARGKAVCVQRHLGSNRGGIGVGDVVLTLSRSVVGVLLILGRDGQRSRVDLHGAEHRRHMVLAAHIHSVVTDVVGGIVVLHRTLRDVCHGVACEVNRQDIAVRQSHIIVSQSAMPAEVVGSCHREGKRVVRLTIIRPLLSSRRKRDIYRRAIAHRQGARYERDVVVALVGEVEGRGIHRGGHAALRRIGDTAVDYHSPSRRTGRLVCISPALHRIGVAVLSLTGIGQVGGTCRDGHRALGDGERTLILRHGIVAIRRVIGFQHLRIGTSIHIC